MRTDEVENVVDMSALSSYMAEVIATLRQEQKYPAVHIYTSTLHSFVAFSEGRDMPMQEVFTSGCLKEYENWMILHEKSLNTVSTYLHTLRAVYNRWMIPGTLGHNPKLFDGVTTKVVSCTKRSLTNEDMSKLMHTDIDGLPDEQKSVLAYFLLMFLFRGMPFIDLAHLRKKDVQGNRIVYRRHKTGKQMTVCIPKEALPLIKEFRDRRTDSVYLFPILDSSLKGSWNQYKDYLDALCCFNKSLKRLMCKLLPGVNVSSYTARHTWATLAFHLGTTPGIVSQALGHSSLHVTETYLKPFENAMVDEANRKLISSVRKCKWKDETINNIL
ncbi:phage integrase SAM-like domain-containing protein [Bacteroides sp.]|uniref:tyrosine-type recombinase/integrase n=1 Tax=Bacteroides sp. TaxID=29523 RepID=UPI0026158EE7|nr:phage integrase SAM-like domain-containing protein [Bacteroides sp.]